MPSTYTSLLRLEDQANGESDTTWGDITDSNFLMVEHAIAGRAAVTHDDTANYTLTTANNSADEARRMILNIGGALTAARNTVCPTSSKVYVAKNATTGGYATTLKTTAGTGISVPNGKTTLLFCDGTNVVNAIDYLDTLTVPDANFSIVDDSDQTKIVKFQASGITTGTTRTLAVPDAGIKLCGHATGLTANRVPYATGSTGGVLTDSGSFTFDGTNLAAPIVVLGAGAVGSPSLQLSTDTTTGFYRPGANIVALSIISTEAWRTTATGYSKFSNGGTYAGATSAFHEIRKTQDDANEALRISHAGATATNQYGATIFLAGDPNDATRYFLGCYGTATERATIRSNGGFANYSANDVNLSTREVKTGIRRYSEVDLERFVPMLADLDYGVWKYKDQTHYDWNHGPTAEGVRDAFLKHGLTEAVNSVIDEFSPGKLGIVTRDLDNIVMATLIHSNVKAAKAVQELVLRTDEHDEDIVALKAWRGRAETALAANGITVH